MNGFTSLMMALVFGALALVAPPAWSEEISLPLNIRAGDELTITMKSTGSQASETASQERTQLWVWRVRVKEMTDDGGVWSFQLTQSESTVPQLRLINQSLQGRTLNCVVNWQGDCTSLIDWEALRSQILAAIAAAPEGSEKMAVRAIFQNATATTAPRLLIRNYSAVAGVQGRRWALPQEEFSETLPSQLAAGAPIAQTTTLFAQRGADDKQFRVGFRVVQDAASLSASFRESLKELVSDMSLDQQARESASEALGRILVESSSSASADVDRESGLVTRATVESRLILEMPAPFDDKSSRRVDTVEITQALSRQ